MYRALYRKWRPQRFEDVVGQKATVTALKNQVLSGRVGHAYLFTGVRGTGKTTCAKIFAKAVNCLTPQEGDPCGECAICRGIDNGSILDVVEMDAASNNSVNDIRDLRDETSYTPSVCKYKVYIIDEVHMLSTAAFNALLKTLEEPPSHVIFILATTEIQKVPATILSRCQRYDFTRIRSEDIAERVLAVAAGEQLEITAGAAGLIARLADGALRDALSILDTCAGVARQIDEEVVRRMAGVTDKSYLFRISAAVEQGNGTEALSQLAELRQQSVDMKRLTEELIAHYRNLLLAGLPGGRALLSGVAPEEEAAYLETAKQTPQAAAIRAIRTLGGALEKMDRVNDPRIELELALFMLTQGPPEQQPGLPAAKASAEARVPASAAAAVRPFTSAPVQSVSVTTAAAPFVGAASQPVTAPLAAIQGEQPPWEADALQAAAASQSAETLPVAAPGSSVVSTAPVHADAVAIKPADADRTEAVSEDPESLREQTDEDAWEAAVPPDDADAPVETEENPPWENQPGAPVEIPSAAPETKAPAPKTTQAAPSGGEHAESQIQPFAEWEKIVKMLENRDPMLFGALKRSRAYYDGRRVLIDGGRMFRDFIRENRDSQKLLKKVIGEVSGISCGIGPYEPVSALKRGTNAEQALEALEKRGLPVVMKDSENAKR